MPTAKTTAAASTALEMMTALRQVTGKTQEVRALNAAIDAMIAEARAILNAKAAKEPDARVIRPEQVAQRFGRSKAFAMSDKPSARKWSCHTPLKRVREARSPTASKQPCLRLQRCPF